MILAPGVFLAGSSIFLIVVWDAFEAIILPRRVTRKIRLARFYYQFTWVTWRFYARLIPSKRAAKSFLGFYGPISLLVLIAVWAFGLIVGFAMMQFGAGSAVNVAADVSQFLYRHVSERDDIFHAWSGRRNSALRVVALAGRRGVRDWIRLSRRRHRVSSIYFRSVWRTGDGNCAARRAGRHASNGG